MSMWKKTMTWLGLDPDADYEAGGEVMDPTLRAGYDEVTPIATAAQPERETNDFSAVRSLGPMSDPESAGGDYVSPIGIDRPMIGNQPMSNQSLRPIEVPVRDEPAMGSVRAIPASPSSKPQLVAPRSFNDAQEVGDRFRGGAPVILNLQETDAELGRRLMDFCSGLCYGLKGQMQRVGDRVFLMTPADVHLSADDQRLMRDSGLLG